MQRAALAAFYVHVDPLHYLGCTEWDRAVYDLATNHAAAHLRDLAGVYFGTVAAAFCGVNPFTGDGADADAVGDVDETITPESPGEFHINA